MKTNVIIKIAVFLMISVFVDSLVYGQIKVVGDDYAEQMTGSLDYYDRDVDFERFFPHVTSVKDDLGTMYSNFFDYKEKSFINNLGDTVYWGENKSFKSKNDGYNFSFVLEGNDVSYSMPVGYYVVDGYIFAKDNADAVRLSLGLQKGEWSQYSSGIENIQKADSKELKAEILKMQDGFTAYYLYNWLYYVILKSVNDNTTVYLHGNYYKAMPLNFYHEVESLIGKEIVLTDGKKTVPYEKDVYNNDRFNLLYDAFTDNMLRLEDSKYIVKDVVYKDEGLYVILNGEKTGTFAVKSVRVQYEYTYNDIGLYGYSPEHTEGIKGGDFPCVIIAYEYNNGYNKPLHYMGIVPCEKLALLHKRDDIAKAQREKEMKDRELRIKREKQQKESSFSNEMIAKYGDQYGSLVGKRQVSIGMTQEMCMDAWGYPMNKYRTTTAGNVSEVWSYDYKTRIYFVNGKVKQIDN